MRCIVSGGSATVNQSVDAVPLYDKKQTGICMAAAKHVPRKADCIKPVLPQALIDLKLDW